MQSIVSIKGLSHRYTTAWAIRDINIDITRTGVYGLLGSNGAGKSTTMNILSGVLNQTRGDVLINGVDKRKDPIGAKRNIGFLPQSAPLYLDLTAREFLLYSARLRDVPESSMSAVLEEVMEKCGISHVSNRLLKNLSGGYRQRIGIAQAIIHRPALVILDEPTNGLDPVQIVEVRNLIRDIGMERTVLLSSHILSEIQLLCSEIIMIEQGKLVFADSMAAFTSYIAPQSMVIDCENPPSLEALGAIRGVTRVEKLTPKSFRLFYEGLRSITEQIIVTSVEQQWRLTELSVEKNSVDEIFKQITQNAKKNN